MADLSKLSFLLVDDNRDIRAIMHRLLVSEGVHQMHEATDGEAGLKALQKHHIDIVISDLVMTPMNGLEFTRRVRSLDNEAKSMVPIIMVTSYPEREHVKRAREVGVTEFLVKPITPAHLFGRLADVLERPRAFVRTPTYFGPDRRRKTIENYKGPRRRASDRVIAI